MLSLMLHWRHVNRSKEEKHVRFAQIVSLSYDRNYSWKKQRCFETFALIPQKVVALDIFYTQLSTILACPNAANAVMPYSTPLSPTGHFQLRNGSRRNP